MGNVRKISYHPRIGKMDSKPLFVYMKRVLEEYPDLFDQHFHGTISLSQLRLRVKEREDYRVVYFLWCESLNVVKIGATWGSRLEQRVKEVQTGCPGEITNYIAIPMCDIINERHAHKLLKHCRTYGEWYDDSSDEVSELSAKWLKWWRYCNPQAGDEVVTHSQLAE